MKLLGFLEMNCSVKFVHCILKFYLQIVWVVVYSAWACDVGWITCGWWQLLPDVNSCRNLIHHAFIFMIEKFVFDLETL